MSARIGVGVAGLGRMGQIHAANLAAHVPAACLVRVVDTAADRARRVGEQLGVAWSTAFECLLDDAAVDAVVIATPTGMHAEMVEQAAAARRHIYCEKPLALDVDATARGVQAVSAAGVLLQIGFHRRFDPDLALMHERVCSGKLGDIHFFRASFREPAPPAPDYLRDCGGIFLDTMIHDLDLARWLVGEITEITATTAHRPDNGAPEDGLSAGLLVAFERGALGIIEATRLAGYGYEAATEIVGSQATVRAGHGQARNELQRLAAGHATRHLHVDFHERFADAYRLALDAFIAAVCAGRSARPTGEDALAALRLAHVAADSAAEGRTVRPTTHALTTR